jgi:tetratricopeptide (TPR) repeat protein
LRTIIARENKCALAHALLLYSQAKAFAQNDDFVGSKSNSARTLESLFVAGGMTDREVFVSAASVKYFLGDITGAAKLLESSLVLYPQDALVLRMVQDCYFELGDPDNALRCISRNMFASEESHHLHGHVLGMLAAGYLECDNRIEAEECATRAVQRTAGNDVYALHALLNVYQSNCRVSEGKSVLERYPSRTKRIGEHLVLFNQGCLQVQAGNYVGATRTAEAIINTLNTSESPLIAAFSRAAFLLWLIALNKTDINIANMWLLLAKFATSLSFVSRNHRTVYNIALMMTLSAVASIEENLTHLRNAADGSEGIDVLGSPLQQRNRKVEENALDHIDANLDLIKACSAKLVDFASQEKSNINLPFHTSNFCTQLLDVHPTYELYSEYFDENIDAKVEILYAIESFSMKRYGKCAAALKSRRFQLRRIGEDSLLRDIVDQTMIEAYLRDGQYTNAKLLLCERYLIDLISL